MKSALEAPADKSQFMGTAEVTDPGISSHRAQGQKTSLLLTHSLLDMMSCYRQSCDPLRTNQSQRKPLNTGGHGKPRPEVQIYLLSRIQAMHNKEDGHHRAKISPSKMQLYSLEKFVALLKRMSLCSSDSNWIVYTL